MENFLGEIYMFAGNFAPAGWAMCNGQLMAIDQNQALFALLGTTYGGDGIQTFALPDLRGRIPIHEGQGNGLSNYVQGQLAGSETVTVLAAQMPSHTHQVMASTTASSQDSPAGNVAADSTLAGVRIYTTPSTPELMSGSAVSPAGSSLPHENRMPYLAINFIIALEGIFPSRN